MIISSPDVESKIELNAESPCVLCLENPHEFWKTVNELISAFRGDVSKFTFWEKENQIGAEKAGEILTDFFSFEIADRKIISLLHKHLLKQFTQSDLFFPFQELIAKCEKFLYDLFSLEEFALECEELTLENLLKVCNVKPEKNYQTFLEKIICYLNMIAELKGIEFFVLVGIKNVLNDEELRLLYRHCRFHKFALLLIECGKLRPFLAEERAIIITDDLCEIVENFD